ncbi:hypothetical protein [Glycomyces xiaoerkulensis]|uniref:hypothetical protein n=1 Tax=Glycomyces xiaoerkulensis TaxID=2038139 RepID=UPI000C25943C|nr:hypothetical protein [Glycomyces xiaoerkulensis]
MPDTSLRVEISAEADQPQTPEVLGEWITEGGSTLSLVGKLGGQYTSIWMQRDGSEPCKIGRAEHAGGVLRAVSWDEPWREQTDAWKEIQRHKVSAILAERYAEQAAP